MTKLIIYLKEIESTALKTLAEQEYRAPKAQASLIIRQELERLGMIGTEHKVSLQVTQPSHSDSREDMDGD